MVWAAILFSLIDAALALLLIAFGAHGGAVLQAQAPLVFVASIGATWTAWAVLRRRPRRMAWKWFLIVALASASLAPAAAFATISYYGYTERRHLRRNVVTDVVDELILAPDGHPLGVRLRFQFMTPDGGHAFPRPEMWTEDHSIYLSYNYEEAKADGIANIPDSFEAGRTYALEFELKPNPYFRDKGRDPCKATGGSSAPLLIQIGGTSFGMPENGGRSERTQRRYDAVKMFQRASPCP